VRHADAFVMHGWLARRNRRQMLKARRSSSGLASPWRPNSRGSASVRQDPARTRAINRLDPEWRERRQRLSRPAAGYAGACGVPSGDDRIQKDRGALHGRSTFLKAGRVARGDEPYNRRERRRGRRSRFSRRIVLAARRAVAQDESRDREGAGRMTGALDTRDPPQLPLSNGAKGDGGRRGERSTARAEARGSVRVSMKRLFVVK